MSRIASHPRIELQLAQVANAVNSEVRFVVDLALPNGLDAKIRARFDGQTEPVLDMWLYVFSVDGFLMHEAYVEPSGKYRLVNPGEHQGRDVRPLMTEPGGTSEGVMLIAGSRLFKGGRTGFNPACYYVLASPFQLPWKQLPHIDSEGKASEFEKWAVTKRGLTPVVLGDHDSQDVAIVVPWLTAMALNQAFQQAQGAWWATFYSDPAAATRAQLRSCVWTAKAIVEQKPLVSLAKLIDLEAFHTEDLAYRKQHDELTGDLEHVRTHLTTFLGGKGMEGMDWDALVSPDPRARALCHGIWAEVLANLNAPGGDPEFLERFLAAHPTLGKVEIAKLADEVAKWVKAHPELKPPGQPRWERQQLLRAVKLEWNLHKTFVAFREAFTPAYLAQEFVSYARLRFGAVPVKGGAPTGGSARMTTGIPGLDGRFTFKTPARTARRIAASPEFNEFIMVVDAWFLARAYEQYAKQPPGRGDYKPLVAAAGIFMNSTAASLARSLQRHEVRKLVGRDVAALVHGLDDAPIVVMPLHKLTPQQAVHRVRVLANSPRGIEALGKVFGALGALFGLLTEADRAERAKAHGDDVAAVGHGVLLVTNFVAGTGYVIAGSAILAGALAGTMVGIPAVLAFIGASLIAGGSAASLVGSLLMPLLEHDPLELWLLASPWGRKKNQDSDKLDEQLARFYPALAGLDVECVFGVPDSSFSLTIRCRLTQDPEEIWLGYSYVSEAGAFRRAFSPLTAKECVPEHPGAFALKVFSASPKLVNVEVQFRPKDSTMPCYPERPMRPKPFTR